VPGDIQQRTGGYGYDRAIVAGLRDLGWDVEVCSLDDSYPFPCEDARSHATRALAALPDGTLVLADGLAFGAMGEEAEREASRLRFVALVHHPLALESGLDLRVAQALRESETRALGAVRGVVVTSAATVQSLRPYGIAPDAVAVIRPGTDPAPVARGTRGIDPPHPAMSVELLSVASLTPRKGYDVLFHALSRLPHLQWHLTCAGSPHLHPETADALASQVLVAGLADRVTFVGELGEAALAAAYDRADVFVLATRHEGYGMAVAEAVARGLPVVSTPTGAIPELVDAASGVLVPNDDVEALTSALERLVNDHERARLTEGARRRRHDLPTWQDAAREMAAALERYRTRGIVQP